MDYSMPRHDSDDGLRSSIDVPDRTHPAHLEFSIQTRQQLIYGLQYNTPSPFRCCGVSISGDARRHGTAMVLRSLIILHSPRWKSSSHLQHFLEHAEGVLST
jgi:hypothetical protein